MGLYSTFLSPSNFDLAFERLLTGSNGQYKNFFRHLYSSYDLTRRPNLEHLIADIKSGKYQPSPAEIVYFPKSSGVLRPLALLTLDDQIVYQAIVNVIARRFKSKQWSLADKLTFGAVYAGDTDIYFYRHWRFSYQSFNNALKTHFQAGYDHFSEFDLVSYYELIDHELLKKVLAAKVNSASLLNLLFGCLQKWTADHYGQLRHGIPQGPLSSAFLAECFLFDFDRLKLDDVVYLRYVDDVRILGKRPQPIRRALIKLDLMTKRFGLVPQAQKITAPRRVQSASELTKTIPSQFRRPGKAASSQRELRRLFLESTKYKKSKWTVVDATSFKFCLYRMRPTRAVLRRVVAIGKDCPDFAPAIATYLSSFGPDPDVFRGTLEILRDEPVYDAVASAYLGVLAATGPSGRRAQILKTLRSIRSSSVEGSSTLKIALADFIARINGLPWIQKFLGRQSSTLILTRLIESLFVSRAQAVFSIPSCRLQLTKMCQSADPDTARYAASVIVTLGDLKRLPRTGRNPSVDVLLHGAGIKRTGPKKSTVLEVFFKERMGIQVAINWQKAFGLARREVEQRCLRMQQLANGDQSARVLLVDTFNDVLTQYFCPAHPKMAPQYKTGTKPKKHHPDFGYVVNAKFFSDVVPLTAAWFKLVHDARIGIDLAHATGSSGAAAGKHTKPIKHKEAEAIMKGAKAAWTELLKEWATLP